MITSTIEHTQHTTHTHNTHNTPHTTYNHWTKHPCGCETRKMREFFFIRPHAPDCEVYQFVIEETKRTGHKLMFKAPHGFWNLNPKVSTEQSAE